MTEKQTTSRSNGKRIDWQEVHARLAQSKHSLETAFSPDAATTRAILEERARQFATREQRPQKALSQYRSVMRFTVAQEKFALDLKQLSGVVPCRTVTPMPDTGPEVLGLTSCRGELWALLDLVPLLDLTGGAAPDEAYALLLRCEGRRIAIRADRTGDIAPLSAEDLLPASECGRTLNQQYADGLMRDDSILLNAAALCRQFSKGETD